MARKITIRRVGGFLPAICLVALILLVSVFVWLSTAGLPQSVLRGIEAEAAKEGIYLHIGKLRLAPSAGLALRAHGVALYAAPGDSEPLARVHKATLGISVMALLQGDISPHMVQVYGAEATLPCSAPGEALRLADGNFSATIHGKELVRLTSASLKLAGIPLRLRGSFHLPQDEPPTEQSTEQSQPLDLAARLRAYQAEIDSIHRCITRQRWEPGSTPTIELGIEDARGLRLTAHADLPRFDYEQFHLRDAVLDLAYHQGSITINAMNFKTVEPDSTVSLQGGYDIANNRVSFSLESTAALARMAEAFDLGGANEWLARYRHEDDSPPTITLRGDVSLEEDYSPKSITVRGRLQQEEFRYGGTQVDKLGLSFFYRDGNFNIDQLSLHFPQGTLNIAASASGTAGEGRARVAVDMEIPLLLGIINEFTGEDITLPAGLSLQGRLRFSAEALLDMPVFEAGQTDWRHYVPSLHGLALKLGIDQAGHMGCELETPELTLTLQGISHDANLIPERVEKAELQFSAASATIPLGEGKPPLALGDAGLALQLTGLLGNADTLTLDGANGSLKLGSLILNDLRAEDIELAIDELRQLRPLETNWRRMLQQASLRLSTGMLHSDNTLLGTLDSALALDADGHVDLGLTLEREGDKIELDLHPELREDGLLVLDNLALEVPVAAFEPLLALAGIADIPHIRLPESISLAGNAAIDTEKGLLRRADAHLRIPHMVRTPGSLCPPLQGKEIPVALEATLHALGRDDGYIGMQGGITLTHKAGTPTKADNREMQLSYSADTDGHIHLSGTNSIDVSTLDALIDNEDAHMILRDFRTDERTRTRSVIRSASIDLSRGLDMRADCEVDVDNFEFQLGAVEVLKDAQGKPTGREKLRSDFGPNPFARLNNVTGRVQVHRRKDWHDEQGRPQPDISLITITDADIDYDNRPWMKRRKIKDGPASSRLQGKKILIDVEHSFVEIFDVAGKVYPTYALGAFYDDLHEYMKMAHLPRPASIEAEHCLFPIYSDCTREMAGCIRMMAREAEFSFIGTTFPLRNFSGFIWLRDDSVYLDRLNAACWEGALNAAVNIDYGGKHTSFDGYATVQNMNLRPIAASYGSKQENALCNGQIRFRAASPEIEDVEAYGDVHIVNGDLMSLSIFRPVGELITDLPGYFTQLEQEASKATNRTPGWVSRQASALFRTAGKLVDSVGDQIGHATNNIPFANHFLRYDLQEVHGQFLIDRGWLRTRDFKALGYNLNVSMRLAINLDSLEIQGNIWPKISSVPTIILSPLTFLSKFVVDINIYGTVEDLKWRFGLDKRLQYAEAPDSSATDKPADTQFKPRRP